MADNDFTPRPQPQSPDGFRRADYQVPVSRPQPAAAPTPPPPQPTPSAPSQAVPTVPPVPPQPPAIQQVPMSRPQPAAASTPARLPSKKVNKIALAVAGVGLLVLLLGVVSWWGSRLPHGFIKTNGAVVSNNPVSAGSSQYATKIQFVVQQDGKLHSFVYKSKQSVESPAYIAGQAVKIGYSPSNPDTTVRNLEAPQGLHIGRGVMVAGLIFFILGSIWFILGRRTGRAPTAPAPPAQPQAAFPSYGPRRL